MRICIDLSSLADNFSGIERFALCITKELVKNKDHTWVLVFKNRTHEDFTQNIDNVEKIVIKGQNKLLFNQIILPLKLSRIKADRYFFPAFPSPFFFFNKHAINTIHDLSCWDCPSSNKKYMIWYFKIMYWKASLCDKKIVTVSNFSRNRICSILKVKLQNIAVIYNGISNIFFVNDSDETIFKKYNIPKDYLLCLSTLEPRKNLELLIKAFIELNKKIESHLVLVGRKGWMMDKLLENIPEDTKIKIHFTGFVDDGDLPSIYRHAKWFVFPSMYEGFGIPPLEAMASGTPVLSSDAACMPEILGDAAIYFKNNDIESLMNLLIEIQNIKIDNKYRQRCIKKAKEYSWEVSAYRLLNFISK